MKRILLLLFTLLIFSGLKASDTLTIRQIYNFDVGDTFDYYTYGVQGGYPDVPYYTTTIIVGKTLMTDSIMYIFSYTGLIGNDTVWVRHLDSNAVNSSFALSFSTYSNLNTNNGGLLPFINIDLDTNTENISISLIDSASVKNNQCYFPSLRDIPNWDSAGNDVAQNGLFYLYDRFQSGLGVTYYQNSSNDGVDGLYAGYSELICYSKAGIHVCTTPYFALGINDLSNISNVKVYPNPASDQLQLSVTNAGQFNAQFIITDILGQQVYSSPVTQAETTQDISSLATGIYIWSIVSDNVIIKTGKVIKE